MKTKITHTIRIDDGTTLGKEILIDNHGKRYQPYSGSPKSLGTNQTLYSINQQREVFVKVNYE